MAIKNSSWHGQLDDAVSDVYFQVRVKYFMQDYTLRNSLFDVFIKQAMVCISVVYTSCFDKEISQYSDAAQILAGVKVDNLSPLSKANIYIKCAEAYLEVNWVLPTKFAHIIFVLF